jgi:glycosyltransferase involved in cell wall biosynthesis
LFFVGSGDGACELRNLIHAVGLDERAFLLGWTDKPAEYLRRAALLLHAARYETFGNVLVESLACGTPVVVTDCGQVLAEVLSGGRYGSIVPQDDADAYVAATREALRRSQADPAWRQGLSEYARSTFDLALTRQRYLALVEQEAARRGLGPRPNPA